MTNLWVVLLGTGAALACTPGYIKSGELEKNGQGPSACAKSCEDLGMRMTAMVLVGDTVPGCVCQPVTLLAPAPVPSPPTASPPAPSAPTSEASPEQGAAASSGGYVLIAAAAAARAQQEQQRRLQQQQQQNH
jgi:hypothetical protein